MNLLNFCICSFILHVLLKFSFSPLSQNAHRVWPLSPAPFIYKAVIWNTMLTVCSPMLAVSTEPCGAANLSPKQCLEFDTQQSRVFSVSWELITKSLAPQISLSPLNHYIRLNVPYNDQNTIKNDFIWHRCIIMNTWRYRSVSEFLRSFFFTPLTCSSRKKNSLQLKKWFTQKWFTDPHVMKHNKIPYNKSGRWPGTVKLQILQKHLQSSPYNFVLYSKSFEAIQYIFVWKYRNLSHYSLIIISTDPLISNLIHIHLFSNMAKSKRVNTWRHWFSCFNEFPEAIHFHCMANISVNLLSNFLFSIWW